MRRILLFSLFSFGIIAFTYAQTGPGGVGNSSNNILWLDASQLGLSDGDPVSNWTDVSGNGNDATQLSSSRQPTYRSNILNNQPVISFDGTNDLLDLSSHITDAEITLFTIFKSNTAGGKALLEIDKHFVLGRNIDAYVEYNTRFSISKSGTSPSIFSLSSDAQASSNFFMTCDNNSSSVARTSFHSAAQSTIGGSYSTINYSFNGYVPELALFNRNLNSAERNIIINYFSTKYNRSAIEDYYAYDATFGHSLIGIGQEADGNHTVSRGRDSLLISNPSTLSDGDYLLIGNDNGGYGTTTSGLPKEVVERWNQIWRADQTGTLGTIDLEFFLGSNGFSSVSNYVVLIETDDGDFSNGGTSIHESGRSFDAGNLSIKFTGVNLPDGAYFTLAEKESDITSIASGLWSSPATWSCACVPAATDIATISSGHDVSVSSASSIYNLTVDGTLSFGSTDTLYVHNSLNINGTLNSNDGTIAAVRSDLEQDFSNNSASIVEFNNLYVNNISGLNLTNGGWSIKNALQVVAGGLDVSSSDSTVLLSSTTQTSYIRPSMDNAFTGDFIVQRYISPRSSNYGDLSSPITSATVAQLDDDLYLSGVNGNDGNATTSSGGTFYSVYSYDRHTDQHVEVTSTTTPLTSGRGYEVYLASTLSQFDGATVDYIGVPYTGSTARPDVNRYWNLIGNPYHSFIDWNKVNKTSFVDNSYYIYNTDNGSYDFHSGTSMPPIAPGQGFWVYQPNSGGYKISFTENDKVDSNSPTFYRKKSEPYFNLNISNNQNPFKHKMRLAFDAFATAEMDEKDAPHLPSPIKEAPAIYSKAINSKEELIVNSLNPAEKSQLVPISIKAGVAGTYEVSADNLDALYESYSCVYLKDQETEEAVDLMVEPKYSFEAEAGKSDRFHLILSNSYEECQEMLTEGEFNQKLDTKVSLRNAYEQWYLDYTLGENQTQLEVRIYSMSGQEVKAPQSFEANGAGTYPLQNLNDLDGIYLIQVIGKDIFLNKQVKL